MNWTEEEYAAYLAKSGKQPPDAPKKSKYKNKRTNGYASRRESEVAAELYLRAKAEPLVVLEQVAFPLPGGVKYVADFVLLYPGGESGAATYEILDAKGFRTDVFKIKAKQMKEIWSEVNEV